MLRFAVCDDNPMENELTCELLTEYVSTRRIEAEWRCFTDGSDLILDAEKESYDIYLIDMIMPEIDGMEVAHRLRDKKDKGHIVFLTATDEFIKDSFVVRASNYLIKPIDTAALFDEIDRIRGEIQEIKPATISIKQGKTLSQSVLVRDILYVETEDRVLVYHIEDGNTIRGLSYRCKFQEAVSELTNSHNFAVVGTGIAVNMSRVNGIRRKDNVICFDNGKELICSRTGIIQLIEILRTPHESKK